MTKRWAFAVVGVMLLAGLACGPLGSLGNAVTGGQAGTASSLWSDVPAYPGAEKVDLEMPLVIRLAVQAFSKSVMSSAGDASGNLEFIAFTTKDSAQQVQDFYTTDRMVSEGWDNRDDLGCGLTAAGGAQDVGGMCAFYKTGDPQDSALFIVAASGENGETSVFYIRIDANPDKMATSEAQ
ncbi:MAG TPA: hypothetical protein VK449_12215 [Anaerolineales bacterium]|nr:hypothetical protein [Anaerolineales bacterium]